MRRRRRMRFRKFLVWGFLFVSSVLIGSAIFAYTYITDSDTLAAMIRDEAPRYLPESRVQIDRVMLRPFVGDIELKQTTIWQTIDGASVPTLRIPWLSVRSDFRSLIWGKVTTREVAIARPELKLRRRKDGTWNLQGFLADPFPQTNLPKPVINVSRGTIELMDGPAPGPILSEVTLKIEPLTDGSYKFEGDARGVSFERIALAGTLHPKTGRIVLSRGDLRGLTINEGLKNRVPASLREPLDKLGLESGELDISIGRLVRDPAANIPLDYEVGLTLRSGDWRCPKLPFPLSGLSASITVTPSTIRIDHAEGFNGNTIVRVEDSTLSACDMEDGPFDINLRAKNLELDERLKAKTPEKLAKLWIDYSPPGRKNLGQVSASVHATRTLPGEPIIYETDVDLLDVAIEYALFKYPLEHIRGKLTYKDKVITVKAATAVGGKPLTGEGTIYDPGPNAVVSIDFFAGAMPIDKTLLNALPPEARKVVEDFQPEGTVQGHAIFTRTPAENDPKGKFRVDAELDLNENCSMRWKALPYPIRNVTGHLSLHPDRWILTNMKGTNNLAEIAVGGRVIQVSKGKFDVDIKLQAVKLPFDDQLKKSLQPQWQRTWDILNPAGLTDVDAHIVLVPGKDDDYKITIRPRTGTHVQLKLTPAPGTIIASGAKIIELPRMDGVTGTFFFDNGLVQMNDVDFRFRQAPVHVASGQVRVKNTGAFDLHVEDLSVKGLRLEAELRSIMPPVMASFARRLDDGKTFLARGDLNIGWNGVSADPAYCSWDKLRVVFNQNAIDAGIRIDQIQGEIHDLKGRFDGKAFSVGGVVELASVNFQGQHLTNVRSAISVADGRASLAAISADFLGGKLMGDASTTLDATPSYEAAFQIEGARLEEYAKSVAGHQDYKGEINAQIKLSGLGQDLKRIKGQGEANVTNGDLGKLPIFLELIQPLNLPKQERTKFDAASVGFTLDNGIATLNAIEFTSNAMSLRGSGTVGHQGALNLRFTPVFGRDERPGFRGVRDAIRAVESQLLLIRVGGTLAQYKIVPEILPVITRGAGSMLNKIAK